MSLKVIRIDFVGAWDHAATMESVEPNQQVYFIRDGTPQKNYITIGYRWNNIFNYLKGNCRYDCLIENNMLVNIFEHKKEDRYLLYLKYFPFTVYLFHLIDEFAFSVLT